MKMFDLAVTGLGALRMPCCLPSDPSLKGSSIFLFRIYQMFSSASYRIYVSIEKAESHVAVRIKNVVVLSFFDKHIIPRHD